MKRANGTGSVVKLSGHRRKPYVVRISYRDKYGVLKQSALSYHEKAAEAQAALDQYNQARAVGAAAAQDQLSMTVGQIYEAWSAREFKKLKSSSIYSHRAAWTRVSRFSGRKMRDMTLDQWQSILDEDEEECRSQSLINNDALLIKALYRYSMERDIVAKDYSDYLDIPSVDPKRKKGAFTDVQMAKLEQMARDGVAWAPEVLMMCYTGFRISEFLGLTVFSYHADGNYLQGGGKTRAGRDRIVPVHQKIYPYLMERLKAAGDTIISRNGKPIQDQWFRTVAFPPIAQALGVPDATPHWCRHTFATRLHRAGVDELTCKWLMGHSTAADVTSGYTHKTLDMLTKAIEKIA